MHSPHHHYARTSRRTFLGTAASAGALLGLHLFRPPSAMADPHDDGSPQAPGVRPKPIPGARAPLAPFGIVIHHNPLNPDIPLADLNDPSQITDFDGFVGLTNMRGGGTGTTTATGATLPLAYRADMGFSQGRFIGTDGRPHQRTFACV